MDVPSSRPALIKFCEDMVEQCNYSQKERTSKYKLWEALYSAGSTNGVPAKHNKCYTHIDKLSSLIYSPADIRFVLEFEDDQNTTWDDKCRVASKHLNRQFIRRNMHVALSPAVEAALKLGSYLFKVTYTNSGYAGHLVHPSNFGVWQEDVTDLGDQECFVHTMRISRQSLKRLLYDAPDREDLLKKVQNAEGTGSRETQSSSYQVFADGVGQLQTNGSTTAGSGNLLLSGSAMQPEAVISPDVGEELVDMYEIWVQDSGTSDWTTLRYVKPGIIVEGRTIKRNLCDAKHCQPFVKICPKETPGYFWGESALARVMTLQELKNTRFDQIDKIFARQINPARYAVGMPGMTDEKLLAMLAPGGTFTQADPGGEIKEMKPELPQGSLEYLKYLDELFDDAGGVNAMLSGEGSQGIRSGNHAASALKMSGPRLRDMAVTTETQVAEVGQLCFSISQAKNANVFKDEKNDEFLLSQIPDDAFVAVDSHTSSPIFSSENENRAFALFKGQVIDGESLLEMVHPPRTEELITKYHKMQAEKAKFIQQHPEVLAKGKH